MSSHKRLTLLLHQCCLGIFLYLLKLLSFVYVIDANFVGSIPFLCVPGGDRNRCRVHSDRRLHLLSRYHQCSVLVWNCESLSLHCESSPLPSLYWARLRQRDQSWREYHHSAPLLLLHKPTTLPQMQVRMDSFVDAGILSRMQKWDHRVSRDRYRAFEEVSGLEYFSRIASS